MRCDTCDRYRIYGEPVVAVRIEAGDLTATVEREDTPAAEQPAARPPVGRYHVPCYEAERARDPRLPVARPERA